MQSSGKLSSRCGDVQILFCLGPGVFYSFFISAEAERARPFSPAFLWGKIKLM